VKGVDEAKSELEEIVEYLKAPQKFTKLGGKLPKVGAALHCWGRALLLVVMVAYGTMSRSDFASVIKALIHDMLKEYIFNQKSDRWRKMTSMHICSSSPGVHCSCLVCFVYF
jgi:hypothetical protein